MKISFVQDWLEKGNHEFEAGNNNGYIYAFFCYFIAFNWLYSEVEDTIRANHPNKKKIYEYELIKEYLQGIFLNEIFKGYDPYALLVEDTRREIKSHLVATDDLHHSATVRNIKSYIKDETNPKIQLFLCIYQIRCNLFHGSKDMRNPHNQELVYAGACVLKDFLKKLCTFGLAGDDYV